MRHRPFHALGLFGLLVFLGLSPALAESPAPSRPAGVERLTHLAKLWGTVRYLHPYLAYRGDRLGRGAGPGHPQRCGRRGRPQEYAAAVQDDARGARRSGHPRRAGCGHRSSRRPPASRRPCSPALDARDARRLSAAGSRQRYGRKGDRGGFSRRSPRSCRRARAVIVDIRSLGLRYRAEILLQSFAGAPRQPPGVGAGGALPVPFRLSAPSSARAPAATPRGSRPCSPSASRRPPARVAKRVVFLVNADTVLPPVAAALQAAGDGAIVAEGKV